jgi:SNF2 family DNA or RNA helicase
MDRNAYLVTLIADLNAKKKAAMAEQLALQEESELWPLVEETMRALYNATGLRIPGMDPETLQTFRSISKIFAKYALLSSNPERSSRPSTLYAEASHKRDLFTHFYHACHDILDRDPESQPLSQVRVLESSDVGDSDEEDKDADEEEVLSPRKKNKKRREYKENIEARQQRDLDVRLREEQNQRREKLRRKLAFGNVDADRERIIINETKRDEEGFIYVHDHIARRIKPHQVEGVRFMWSQVVLKEGAQQGCLLAHTMGLGKTMQVITLLVAIIEAATSSDSSITSQIPDHLKRHKILILAPPGLLNNWMDELLMWFPEDLANRIGGFRTVDSSVPGSARISMIQAWYEDHGILLLGYQMFRTLVGHERGKKFDKKFDEFREELTKYLLDGPDIIIADEAHQMRNPKSGLGEAVARFRSASRIALTGSPLSNNVLEYHAMINWVAHNYLGPLDEFQAKYARDIKEGLYVESTPTERKRAKKRLAILTEDIGPKVHRADLQVIIDQVPEKKEYVLMTPLTEIQERAYNFFVAARNTEPNDDILTKEGNIKQTALWSWINALSLLDCHPAMYLKALEDKEKKLDLEKAEQKKKSKQDREDSTSEGAETTSLALEPKLQEFREIFSQFGSNWEELAKADLVDLSFRTKITLDIVKACRAAQDKVLIFSHRVATLDYLQHILTVLKFSTARLDGRIVTKNRQQMTKDFNTGHTEVFLISTTAGAIGLNLAGANRVVIFDFGYNPTWEEQAVGRAFRIGQTKPVFVYHLCAAGTYEERLYNQIVFKKQLFATVVDKQDVKANAKKVQGDVLKRAERVNQEDLSPYEDHDPQVLGKLLALQKAGQDQGIRRIIETDTLRRKDDDVLDDMDRAEIARETKDNAARRRDPVGWQRKKDKIAQEAREKAQAEVLYYQQMHGLPGRPALMPSAPMRRQSVTGSSAMPFSATQPALQTFTPLPILPPTSQPPGPKLYGSPLPQRKQHDGNASIQPSGPFTAAANMPEKPPMVIGGELRLIQGSPATAIHAAHNQQAFANNASAASVTAPPSSNGTKSASILPGDTVASKSPAKSPVKAALSTVNGLMLANSTTAKVDCKEDHRIKSLANILGELSDEKAARHSRRISISADNTPLGGVPSASVQKELNTGTSQSKSLPATAANSPAMTQRKPSNGRSTPPSIAIHENGMELRLYSRNELRAMKQTQRPLALAAMEAFRDRQEALGKGVAVSPDYHDAWESVEEDNSPGGGNNGKKHNVGSTSSHYFPSGPQDQDGAVDQGGLPSASAGPKPPSDNRETSGSPSKLASGFKAIATLFYPSLRK